MATCPAAVVSKPPPATPSLVARSLRDTDVSSVPSQRRGKILRFLCRSVGGSRKTISLFLPRPWNERPPCLASGPW